MSSPVRYACPHCSRRIQHNPEFAGQMVICSACGGKFIEPTDPLPGKDAERLPPPLPEATTTRDYALALMTPAAPGDMQTMQEVFEAQIIDEPPQPKPAVQQAAYAWPPGMASPPPPPSTRPVSAAAKPSPATPPLAKPTAAKPAPPPPPANIPPARVPTAIPKAPIPATGLAGVSPQQMLDELGRRGLVCVLLVHDYSEEETAQLRHTQHLNTQQAVSLLAEYLMRLQQSGSMEEDKAGMLAAMKRLWSGDEDFLQAASRLWGKRE